MRRVRVTLVAVAAICMPAFAVGVAQANQFIAKQGETTEGEFHVKGASGTEDPQVFELGETEVTCDRARETGTLLAPNETLEGAIQFKRCSTEVHDGALTAQAKVTVKGPLLVAYGAEGGLNDESSLMLDIKALNCDLTLTQFAPGEAQYVNETVSTRKLRTFPAGFQHKLVITGELALSMSPTTPTSCPNFGAFGKGGKNKGAGNGNVAFYEGTVFEEAVGADLGFEEGETPPGGWNRVKNAE